MTRLCEQVSCNECFFFKPPLHADDGIGNCLRHSPRSTLRYGGWPCWPQVSDADVCGEFLHEQAGWEWLIERRWGDSDD